MASDYNKVTFAVQICYVLELDSIFVSKQSCNTWNNGQEGQ